MSKRNGITIDQLIAKYLINETPYEIIKNALHVRNSRIFRISTLLKNNQPIESAKIGHPPNVISPIIQT